MIQIGIVMYLTIKFHKSIYVTLPPSSVSSKFTNWKYLSWVEWSYFWSPRPNIWCERTEWLDLSFLHRCLSIFTPQGRKPNFVAPQVTNGYITLKTEKIEKCKNFLYGPRIKPENLYIFNTWIKTLAFMEQMLFIWSNSWYNKIICSREFYTMYPTYICDVFAALSSNFLGLLQRAF